MANEMLANTTLAGQEGTLEYLASNAALQQWCQAALALLVLQQSPDPLTPHELERRAEDLLEHHFQVLRRLLAGSATTIMRSRARLRCASSKFYDFVLLRPLVVFFGCLESYMENQGLLNFVKRKIAISGECDTSNGSATPQSL